MVATCLCALARPVVLLRVAVRYACQLARRMAAVVLSWYPVATVLLALAGKCLYVAGRVKPVHLVPSLSDLRRLHVGAVASSKFSPVLPARLRAALLYQVGMLQRAMLALFSSIQALVAPLAQLPLPPDAPQA